MELRYLKYFVTVVEERSFRQAAARLRMAQPTISHQVKILEDELGVPLLIREGNKVSGLSPAGKDVFVRAKNLLKQAEKISDEIKRHHHPNTKRLSVGVGFAETMMSGMLMPAILNFKTKHPDIELEVLELDQLDQVEALRSRRIDLGFIGTGWEKLRTEFETIPLRKFPVAVVLPITHPLASRNSIKLSELSSEGFIVPSKKVFPGPFEEAHHLCQKAGFTPFISHQVDSLVSTLALVGMGKGVCLLPKEFGQVPHPNAVFKQVSTPALELNSVVAYCKSDQRQIIVDLINAVKKHFSRSRKHHSPILKGPQPK